MTTEQLAFVLFLSDELLKGMWVPNMQQNEAALRARAAHELRRLHALFQALIVENETLHAENKTLRAGYDACAALATPAQVAALVSPSDDGFMAAVNEMDGLYAAPLAITSAPERIWLDLGINPYEEDAHFSNLHDLTWSQNNATGGGIEYVRADLAAHNSLSL